MRKSIFLASTLVLLLSFSSTWSQTPEKIVVPAGGNIFPTGPVTSSGEFSGMWDSPENTLLFFFHAGAKCRAELFIHLFVPEGKSRIEVRLGGKKEKLNVSGKELQRISLGKVDLASGYNRIEFKGITREGHLYAIIDAVEIVPSSPGTEFRFVRDNQDNRFYWGRRGPSVHLNYELPADARAEYFYNELTVPEGWDPVGSYFMADGFGEGYFGMQVNSRTERRILFSVWSPFKTDRPGDIPASDKIILLKKGDGVYTGEFGNEGSGGQSFWRYPWKAGTTYRFLLRGTPDGKGNTAFTAWFNAPDTGWKLIASFSRPKTDHYLTRFHSFLENFSDKNGYLSRRCRYANQWYRDPEGTWHPLAKARFTGDDIARRGYRLDFAGGLEGSGFFLRNGGFFNQNTPVNSFFNLDKTPVSPPELDLSRLP